MRYDGRHRVGEELAQALRDAARISVGRHHSEPYQLRIRYACEDIVRLQQRLRELEADIALRLERHQVGKLLTTINGIGPQTAACIIAELGDPARFGSVKALASYVGVIPRLRQSGKRRVSGRRMLPLGNARLRRALWMPTLSAIRVNPWLRAYYLRLRGAVKCRSSIDDAVNLTVSGTTLIAAIPPSAIYHPLTMRTPTVKTLITAAPHRLPMRDNSSCQMDAPCAAAYAARCERLPGSRR